MAVCFCRFTILTLRPAKILSRKNHTGGGRQQLGERTRLACSQRRLVVDMAFVFDARARRTAAGAAALPISNFYQLLLRLAMQRTNVEHEVNEVNANDRTVLKKKSTPPA